VFSVLNPRVKGEEPCSLPACNGELAQHLRYVLRWNHSGDLPLCECDRCGNLHLEHGIVSHERIGTCAEIWYVVVQRESAFDGDLAGDLLEPGLRFGLVLKPESHGVRNICFRVQPRKPFAYQRDF